MAGKVYFVGAGPGDPELITVKGMRLLQAADVIVYTNSLVGADLLRWARQDAVVVGSAGLTLEETTALLVGGAREGKTVVRLHTGDPGLFGALLEQLSKLNQHGVAYEIVPGVSAVFAAAAALGVELTVPELAQTVILTRLEGRTPVPEGEQLRDLAAHQATLALYLSVAAIGRAVEELLAGGYPEDTPAAVVYRATWSDQVIVRGALADIADKVRAAGIRRHALILVGRALDPSLPADKSRRSRLYDGRFSHLFRRAALDESPGAAASGAAADAQPPRMAVVAITQQGAALGTRLQAAMPDSDLWVPSRFAHLCPAGCIPFEGPLGGLVSGLIGRYRGLVFLVSLGAVVRLIAPHLQDKRRDPAVVVVDDQGRFAIPALSGHLGGANALARRVGEVLGAVPVITTASDVHQTISVDLLGREFGWRIAAWDNVTRVSAAVVNGEPVAFYQDAGEHGWWQPDRPLPGNLRRVTCLDDCSRYSAALVVTDRLQIPLPLRQSAVVYHPRSLVVGVGCNRGTAAAEIREAVDTTLLDHGLAPQSVRNWASIDIKAGEPGLLAAARGQGLEVQFFDKNRLNAVAVPHPSDVPLRHVGAQGVAEPAALVSAGPGAALVVPKQKIGNCTVAVARICFREEC